MADVLSCGLAVLLSLFGSLIVMSSLKQDTVAQNSYDMGYISVETAWKVIKGEKVSKTVDTGINLITKDNAKQKLDFLKGLLK